MGFPVNEAANIRVFQKKISGKRFREPGATGKPQPEGNERHPIDFLFSLPSNGQNLTFSRFTCRLEECVFNWLQQAAIFSQLDDRKMAPSMDGGCGFSFSQFFSHSIGLLQQMAAARDSDNISDPCQQQGNTSSRHLHQLIYVFVQHRRIRNGRLYFQKKNKHENNMHDASYLTQIAS